ncbi:MAG: hypothetical protein Kow0047_14840 [Anaerolineae bacterium]
MSLWKFDGAMAGVTLARLQVGLLQRIVERLVERTASTQTAQHGDAVPNVPFSEIIALAARRFDVPSTLIAAVIKAESNFDPRAVSVAGAKGLMQLMDGTARQLGVTDSFDPAQNIFGGTAYLRQLLDRYDGDLSLALAAYNAGPGAVDRYGGIPPYQETQTYVRRVLSELSTRDWEV